MGLLTLRLLLFREGDVWVGQCLDHDIAAHGNTLREVMERFAQMVFAEILSAAEFACEPITSIPPPPSTFEEQWGKAVRLADTVPIAPWTNSGRAEAEVRIAA